ncbi:DUF2240 family protein [Archaeoglobus neptunius]|uniref:DUF2240 family protein n=1 Tax=Archaeoglobus neptunius TaxID=2798580 RepID=UPI001925866C|nr:DUF2240 family protein [Archaeoglobus neptunius]
MMRKVIAAAFKSKGKRKMTRSELIYTMSFDLNWFTHEGSKRVVEQAEKERLIEGNEEVVPTFDIDDIEVSSDFKPDLSKLLSRSVVDRIVDDLVDKTGKSYQEVISMINAKQEKLEGLVSFAVSALIVAKEQGLKIEEYLPEVEREVFG